MKFGIILLCFFVYPFIIFAGDSLDIKEFMTPRNAVVEIFTNTGSIEGAITYAQLNDFIRKNPEGIIPIVYHTFSPFNNDPFYQINKVMNMKRWSMYSRIFNMSYDNSSAVGGHYYAQDRNDMDSIIRAIKWQKSIIAPVKMSINMKKDADSIEITVNIQSVSNFGKRTVFIYLMDTYYTKYELSKNPKFTALTPNGELYFRWIPRAMIPDEKGLEVKLLEGTDTTLKIKVSTKCSGFMNNNKLYATAVLQSPTSTNLIQAVTTYKPMRAKLQFQEKEVQTGDSSYIKIKRSQKSYFDFTLENPYNFEVTYKVKLYTNAKVFYIALQHFDDTVYTLKAFEKRELQFMVINQKYADFARIDIVINPMNIPDTTMQQDAFFFSIFAVSDGLKCATLYTYPKLENDAEMLENFVYDFAEDWAVFPYDVFMKGFSDMPIKLYYLMLDTRNIPTFGLYKNRVDYCISLLERGKGVIISTDFELAMAQNKYKDYNYTTLPLMQSLLTDKIGITLGTHYDLNITPPGTIYPKVNIIGIPGMEFAKDITGDRIQINYLDPHPNLSVITLTKNIESIKLNGNNPTTKGFLRYDILDSPADEFAGVTSEVGNGRLLYLGFGIENTGLLSRNNIIDNTIYWLIKAYRPKRARLVIKPSGYIDFGEKELFKDTTVIVHISNVGDSTLHITNVYIDMYNNSFTFDTSAIVYRLDPNQSFDLPLKFSPRNRKNMQADLTIESDAYYSGSVCLTLIGKGVLNDKTPPPTGENNYWLDISSNAKSDDLDIKFKPNQNAKNVVISIIDSEGNKFDIPYSPDEGSIVQSLKFNKKLFTTEQFELLIEMDGIVIRKNINCVEDK